MFSPGGRWLALHDTENIATQVYYQRQPQREPLLTRNAPEACGVAQSFSPDDRWLLAYTDVEGLNTGCSWRPSTRSV